MLIEVETLTAAGKHFTAHYEPTELPLEDESVRLLEAVEAKGKASRRGERVRLEGEVRTRIEKACDRCLRPVGENVAATFEIQFVPPAEAASATPVLEAEDLDVEPLSGDTIDFDEIVREQILLAVDMRSLCRTDCKGLCPNCGADLNEGDCGCQKIDVDPRWAALKTLRQS